MNSSAKAPRFVVAIVGCLAFVGLVVTSAAAADAAKKNVTFAKDVMPILQAKCQACHHPETVAPMSLMTYEEVRPWARSIRKRVVNREMPPWHIDRTVGIQSFLNDRSLSDEEINTIANWVDAGAPLGNPKDLPAPLTFNDDAGWVIGKPDLVVTMKEPFTLYARGPDLGVSHYVDLPITEDRYFKSIETRVSKEGRRIVHHAIAELVGKDGGEQFAVSRSSRGEKVDGDAENRVTNSPTLDPTLGTYLGEYALGKYGESFPEGTGRVLKAGSQIKIGMHYHAVGEEVTNQMSIGFALYPKGYVPKRRVDDLTIREQERLDIPPGTIARSDIYYRLPNAVRIIGYQPHMHIRGKAMCMEAIHLNGTKEMLNCVDRYDFNWHIMYLYNEDAAPLLPAGTMLHIVAVHDNTAKSPTNPDSNLWIGWGGRSFDEMTAAHMAFEFMKDEDYEVAVAERQAKQAKQMSLNKTQQ